ncbi:MAG: rRNA (cytosine967-C5)-methyltransferase [Abditibacteriota bacterium]|nr:rRNA (cytosine967-C5)-methyltransferase [Abditibacteriota bacterium]
MHPKTAARHAALRALITIERDDVPLNAALDSLPPETRGFAHELLAGTLRHRARLDWTLAPLLKKKLEKLDAPVRAALRLAAYESTLSRTPGPVVANEYAGLMREEKLKSAVAFVNAVARKLPAEPRAAPPAETQATAHLSVEYSHPRWLVERWLQRFGFDECRALLETNNSIAPLCLRVNTRRASREEVLHSLRERELNVRESTVAPNGLVLESAGSPVEWPEWKNGLVIAQDEAAQLVGALCAPRAGQTVYDLASAPGGKTTHLAQLMNDSGTIIASDRAPGRLKLVQQNAARLGLRSITTRSGDVAQIARAVEANELPRADVVLLDAPCLGTGTLRRRPDAKWKKTPEQLRELITLQRQLLDEAATIVAPRGALVYSTCSLEPEENEMQVAEFLARHAGWQLEAPDQSTLTVPYSSQGWIQTLPQRQRCDGMFAAKLRRLPS